MTDKKIEDAKDAKSTQSPRAPAKSSGGFWVEAIRRGQYPAQGPIHEIGDKFRLIPYEVDKMQDVKDEDGKPIKDPITDQKLQEPVVNEKTGETEKVTVSPEQQFSRKWMKRTAAPKPGEELKNRRPQPTFPTSKPGTSTARGATSALSEPLKDEDEI